MILLLKRFDCIIYIQEKKVVNNDILMYVCWW